MSRQKTPKKGDVEREIDSGRGVKYIENLAWSLTPPWISATGLYVAGAVAHGMWSDPGRLPWATAGLAVASVGTTTVAVISSRARGPITRWLAGITTAAGGGWMVVSTIVGALSDPLYWMYPLLAAPVAVAWNIRRLTRGDGTDAHQGNSQWDNLSDNIQTLRAQILGKSQTGATQVAELELPAGMTQQQAQSDAAALASAYGAPPTGVRITPDPSNGRRVQLSVTPVDMLRTSMPWPGPSAPGRSISEPLVLGTYEDGQPLALTLPGRRGERVVSHILLMGMSGGGKTEALLLLVTEVLTRSDAEVWYLDAGGKADQTVGPIQSGLTKLATTKSEAEGLMEELVDEIPSRAATLAAQGLTEWAEGCGLPFRVVVIDEGADLVAGSSDFVELARKLRSVGVVLVLAIQRATHTQIPTDARANLGTVMCFGVQHPRDESFALSDQTLDAGASPAAWKNSKPGCLYLEDNGIQPERWPIPARTYITVHKDLERTVKAAGPLRWHDADAVTSGHAPTTNPAPAAAAPEPARRHRDDDEDQVVGYSPPPDLAAELEGLDLDAELTSEVPGMDDMLTDPPPTLTTDQAEQRVDALLDLFRRHGRDQFRRSDLIAAGALHITGRKKGWLSGALGRRVDARELHVIGDRSDGIYAFEPAREGARA
jgi:hypothetical protein